ncbi:MAG: glycosyltransferase family 1 protein [Myxococcales bacterium]|nr:glycosyltransferase family 1 protein [Myxococcales bacterium]
MRILMVARRWPPDVRSGTETVFENLWANAVAAGHEVRLVVGFRNSPEGFPLGAVLVDLRRKGPLSYLAMERAAVAEARAFRPDAVLSNSIEIRVPGVRNVVIVHDLNFGAAGQRTAAHRAREVLYRMQAATGAVIVTVSRATGEALAALGIAAVVIPNGVDLERFKPVTRLAPVPDGLSGAPTVRFVYPSRILPGKGQHIALDAFGRLRPDQRKGWELVLVGAVADRIYADQLKVQAYTLPVRIELDVPDIAPYTQQADVVLFPTRMTEGFGFTAVDGMACGKPVIWSEQPAIREATGGIGIAVPMDDAEALKRAMLELGNDPVARDRIGREGRAFVERYSWVEVWKRYERVLAGR